MIIEKNNEQNMVTTNHLDEREDYDHRKGAKEKWPKELKVMAPPGGPEGVESEAHNDHRCENRRQEDHLPCTPSTKNSNYSINHQEVEEF